MIIYLSYWC